MEMSKGIHLNLLSKITPASLKQLIKILRIGGPNALQLPNLN